MAFVNSISRDRDRGPADLDWDGGGDGSVATSDRCEFGGREAAGADHCSRKLCWARFHVSAYLIPLLRSFGKHARADECKNVPQLAGRSIPSLAEEGHQFPQDEEESYNQVHPSESYAYSTRVEEDGETRDGTEASQNGWAVCIQCGALIRPRGLEGGMNAEYPSTFMQ